MTAKALFPSPLGTLTLIATEDAFTGLYMEGQRYFDPSFFAHIPLAPEQPILQEGLLWLNAYFAGHNPDPGSLPLAPRGTPFQQKVWSLLLKIPYGQTVTYGELSRLLGEPFPAAQAVGGAVGRNPISIIIPCHRVLGAKGKLTGYAGGLERKEWLLHHETEYL